MNFIAIDAGGTKTDIILFKESGSIIFRALSEGCNAMDIGKPEALRRIKQALRPVLDSADAPIRSLFGGIAGIMPLGDFMSAEIRPLLPEAAVQIEDDGLNMISGVIGREDGCGMVCGTGSSLFIRKNGQLVDKVGGKGYLIDTGGSGFELGRDAICMAMRSEEGRCRHTVLQELVSERFGRPARDSVAEIYDPAAGGRSFIASFAPLVFQGRGMGDWACEEIFRRGSSLLAELTFAAEKYFGADFKVVMNGGLPSHFPEYFDAVVEKSSPRAKFIRADVPPIYGAAVHALWNAGLEPDGDFKAAFIRDYKSRDAETRSGSGGEL